MISICVYILFIVYAMVEGMCHAVLYHVRNHTTKMPVKNEHIIFNGMRFMVWGLSALALVPYGDCRTGVMLFALLLVFSFFHNGMYHLYRKRFSNGNIYPEGWWSDPSKTSTARFNLNNDLRAVIAIGGSMLYFCAMLYR